MKKYLKYQPAWLQLLLFGSFFVVLFFMTVIIFTPIISTVFNLGPKDLAPFDFSKPEVVSAIKTLQAILSLTFFLIPSLLFAYLSDSRPLHYIGFKKPVPGSFFLLALIIILCCFPMVAWLGDLNQHLHFPPSLSKVENWVRKAESDSNVMLKHMLNMRSIKDLVVMLVILSVIPAIAEELFFRGVLQRLFIQVSRRPWVGIIFTAILFSAFHGQFLGFFPRAVLGIILGALFWYSGSLWPGILAHFLNNALQIIMIYYNPQLVEKDPNFPVWVIAGSTFLVLILTWWMQKISETRFAEVYDTDDDFPIGPRDRYIA